MYFDTTYIAKFYLNEPESSRIRDLVRLTTPVRSSLWALAEFHAVLHRSHREGFSAEAEAFDMAARFASHVDEQLWRLIPVTEALLRRTSSLILSAPSNLFLRAGDAVHLATAYEAGEREVWTNDRHMLAAASYFGLKGRSV